MYAKNIRPSAKREIQAERSATEYLSGNLGDVRKNKNARLLTSF